MLGAGGVLGLWLVVFFFAFFLVIVMVFSLVSVINMFALYLFFSS